MSHRSLILPFFLVFTCFLSGKAFAGIDDGVSTYYYSHGIPGCGCLHHCKCFSCYVKGFPLNTASHPFDPEDVVWHEFMKGFLHALKAAYFCGSSVEYRHHYVLKLVNQTDLFLLSDYLEVIENLHREIVSERKDRIEWLKSYYSKPTDQEILHQKIDEVNSRTSQAFQILSAIPDTIVPLYKEILEKCFHKRGGNLAKLYNSGLIALLEGDAEGSIKAIKSLIETVELTSSSP